MAANVPLSGTTVPHGQNYRAKTFVDFDFDF